MEKLEVKFSFQDLLLDAGTSPDLADRIFRSCTLRELPPRTNVQLVTGDPGGLWGLVEGALAVEMEPGGRNPQMGYLLLPPVWVGEGSVIAGTPRSVGLSTTRRSALMHFPAARFLEIARDAPLIWQWIAKIQKQNFERSLGMTGALMVPKSEVRVAAVLKVLGGRLGQTALAPRELDITHAQLAAIANVSRSVLSPALQALAAKGAIKLGHGTITVTDPAALA